jgi:DNA-binding transcriptional ArsR family regulator
MPDARYPRPGPEALKAFVHPLRIAMFEYLRDHGPATATQLARALGESTGQTSYHLRQLARHGFVEDDPEHVGGRERWWRPVGFAVDGQDLADDAMREAIIGMLGARFATRAALVRRWLEHLPAEDEPWREVGASSEGSASMTAEELSAMAEELEDAMSRHLDAAKRRREAGDGLVRRRVRVYIDAFPMPPEPS